eukprot:gene25653-38550_t
MAAAAAAAAGAAAAAAGAVSAVRDAGTHKRAGGECSEQSRPA